jgi:hypothetical protein
LVMLAPNRRHEVDEEAQHVKEVDESNNPF